MQNKIDKTNVEDIVELNRVQEGMLYHYLQDENRNLYNVQLSFRINGFLDRAILQEALNAVQSAHQALRSVFRWEKLNKPVQVILYSCPTSIGYTDLSGRDEATGDLLAEYSLRKDWDQRFDLTELPLRLQIIRLGEQSFVLSITHHHILYDGWSTAIFLKDLFYNYNQLVNKRAPLPGQQPSFKDVCLAIKR